MVSPLPNSKGGTTSNRLRSSSTAPLHLRLRANTTSSLPRLLRATGNHLLSPTVRHLLSRMEPRPLLNPTAPHLHPANTTRRHSNKGPTARRRRRLSNHMARSKDTGNLLPSNLTASSPMASPRLSNISHTGNNIRRHLPPPAMARPRSLPGMATRMRAA